MEYKTNLIEQKQQLAGDDAGSTRHILTQLEGMGHKEALELLKKNVGIMISLKEQQQAHVQQQQVVESEIREKEQRVTELEEGLRHARMEQDREMMRVETEHAQEIQRLMAEGNSTATSEDTEIAIRNKQEELDAVNKDLYYYKQSYRELKRKLKKIQTAVKEDVDRKHQECEALGNENAKLHEELKNLKKFMVRHSQSGSLSGVAPVRVSRSSLKKVEVHNPDASFES